MLMRTPTGWARPKRLRPPGFIVPCQPILARGVPAGDGWLHELKHNGYRIIAYKDGERVWLWSRNGRDWSAEFVAITAAVHALPFRRIMLDGKAVTHCLEGPANGVSLRLSPARWASKASSRSASPRATSRARASPG